MYKYLIAFVLAFSLPFVATATPISWDYVGGVVQLLKGQRTAEVKVPYITATSTTATSTFPRASVTSSFRLGSDYITDLTGTGLAMSGSSLTSSLGTAITSSEITDGEIVNADIGASAAIGYSKLALTNSLLEADLKAVDTASDEECLTYETTTGDFEWQSCASGGAGTVTSVAMTVPTGLSIAGSPITTSGTLALTLTAGYNIPLTASTTAWNTFYATPSNRITAGDGLTWSTNTLNFDGGNTPAGDLGGTWASPSVTDDSHAHTGTTLSGIDISSDTNLAGDTEIVLTGDALSIASTIARDSELHSAITLSGALDYITLVGQDIVRGAIDLATDITGVLGIANGGLGGAFTDPNADQLMFWDDSAAKITGIASIVGGAISGTTLTINDVACTGCLGTTEIAGLDVSDDLNLTAGRSLTLTGDDVLADAELYTDSKTIYFESPTASDDFKSLWVAPTAVTITSISCESDQTVTFDLSNDDGTPTGVNGSDIACTTFATDSSLAGDTAMASGDRLDLAVTSVSGTPTWVSITFAYTKDD